MQFTKKDWHFKCRYLKTLLIMKLTFVFFIGFCLQVQAEILAQTVTLNIKNTPLQKVFKEISRQTGYHFIYNTEQINEAGKLSLRTKNASLKAVVALCLDNTALTFVITEKTIIIRRKPDGMIKTPPAPVVRVYQADPVKGVVTNSEGSPLAGVSVQLKGSTVGTSTNEKGFFTIDVPPGSGQILVFSYVGMETKEINVSGQNNISIVLNVLEKIENEFVVVGYGTQKKVSLTGSVVTIDAKKLENRAAPNVTSLLVGQAPGVTVIQRGGSPGRDEGAITIRGTGSFGAASPWYVIDGVPSPDLNGINPNDIASLSILKDASAAAIYGINGANGVILVTTKRGAKQKLRMNYDFQLGGSNFVRIPDRVNAYELASLYNEAAKNDGQPAKFTNDDLEKFKAGTAPGYANVDWVDAVFSKSGTWMQHNLGLSGGTEDTRYNISLGYLDQDGLMQNTNYKRYNVRTNFDQKISERFNVGVNIAMQVRDVTDPPTNQGVGGETWYLNQAFRQWATDPIQHGDGRWAYPVWSGANYNPLAYISKAAGYSNAMDTRVTGTGFAELKIIDGLKLKGIASNSRDFNYSTNIGLGADLYRVDPATGVVATKPENAASMPFVPDKRNISKNFYRTNDINLQGLLTYEKTFHKHGLRALLGTESRKVTSESAGISRIRLANPALSGLNAADPQGQTTSGSTVEYKAWSVFGRLNYIFDDKYIIEGVFRNDATSKFAANLRSRFFPSASLGWVVSKEEFFKVPVVDNLKLRASWGKLGNERSVGNYLYLPTYALSGSYTFDGAQVFGVGENQPLANPGISWESSIAKNIALDLTMLDNKFSLTADYFVRDTRDMLTSLPVPAILGATPPVQNAQSLRNTGFELTVGYKDKMGDVNYFIDGNFSKVKNRITDLAGNDAPGFRVGDPVGNIFGYVSEGIFQNEAQIKNHANQTSLGGQPKPGDIIYKDISGPDGLPDGKVDATYDRQNLGTTYPSINYGLSYGASYKGIDFSMLWQGVSDVKGMLAGRLQQAFWQSAAPIQAQLDRWSPANPDAAYPRTSFSATYNYAGSSFWLVNTSFFKLRNAQIGYVLPESVIHKTPFKRLRIYVSGENLVTFSPSKIIDPETLTTVDPFFGFGGSGAYPTTKRYLAGISLTF